MYYPVPTDQGPSPLHEAWSPSSTSLGALGVPVWVLGSAASTLSAAGIAGSACTWDRDQCGRHGTSMVWVAGSYGAGLALGGFALSQGGAAAQARGLRRAGLDVDLRASHTAWYLTATAAGLYLGAIVTIHGVPGVGVPLLVAGQGVALIAPIWTLKQARRNRRAARSEEVGHSLDTWTPAAAPLDAFLTSDPGFSG